MVVSFICGCSNYSLLLKNSGSFVLSNDNEKIEISNQQQILIEWFDNSQYFVTSALIQEYDKGKIYKKIETSITVNIVEVNSDFIRLSSPAWKTRNNLPLSYLEPSSDLRVIGSKKPTILIPWKQIRTIYLYDRKFTKDDFFDSPKYLLIGATTGAVIFMSSTIIDANSEIKDFGHTDTDEKDIISSGLTGALLGSIVYPIYKYFDISMGKATGENIKKYSKLYPVNQPGHGYEIKIIN